jgi:DNA-binding response OmpR family regulator
MSKILVVEDSRTIGTFIKDFLEEAGYEVEYAADGEEAMRKISEEPPDLVILDVILPKLDGYSIARHLRQGDDGNLKRIPIIMLSRREALIDKEGEAAGLADESFLKPIRKEEMIAAVKDLLKKQNVY